MNQQNYQKSQAIDDSSFDQIVDQNQSKHQTDIKLLLKIILFCLITIILLQCYLIFQKEKIQLVWKTPTKPVTYIWLGQKSIPSKYVNRLKHSKIQTNLLTDEHWNILGWEWQKYPSLKMIEKADILRLIYVYNYGGIYSDFDMYCDYDKLFLELPQQGCYFAGNWKQPVKPDGLTNSWMYCAEPHNKDIKQYLDSIRKNVEQRERTGINIGVLFLTGPDELRQHSTFKALPKFYSYCYHDTDSTWRDQYWKS